MVSNDVAALAPGDACDALLLTAKARVIAPLRIVRRGPEDFLLLTEAELGEMVRTHLLQFRFAARAEIEPETHDSHLRFEEDCPEGVLAVPNEEYGVRAWEIIGSPPPSESPVIDDEELERMRIEARTPRYGREIDERVLPAEAGLVERAVSLTKGCYPGQEPIARLHYRGHANRELRVLAIEGADPPPPETDVRYAEKVVGRVTSAARSNGGVVALAFVRTEVPSDAELEIGTEKGRSLH